MAPSPSLPAFLDDLAAGTATPGAGAAAAVTGAMAASLVSMVLRLTLARPEHGADAPRLQALLAESESLRTRLAALADEDAAAYASVLAAYRLPKADAARPAAIQAAMQAATLSPLACARAAAGTLRLAAQVAEAGWRNVVGDAGTAATLALAALRSAALNVRLNAPRLHDAAFAGAALAETEALLAECGPLADGVLAMVQARSA